MHISSTALDRRATTTITVPDADTTTSPRILWSLPDLNSGDRDDSANMPDEDTRRVRATVDDANLISSLCEDGAHRPVLDIDWPREYTTATEIAHAIAATRGDLDPADILIVASARNWHAYIPGLVFNTWSGYRLWLDILVDAHLVEPGYVGASNAREQTFLRAPEHAKPIEPARVEVPDEALVESEAF